jgi:alginate O-acetyltransferase complex protein AlgI
MLFNSFVFLSFLVVVFLLYWFVFNKNEKTQNLCLLLASWFFYGFWNVKLLALVIAAGSFTYYAGIQIGKMDEENPNRRRFFRFFVVAQILLLCTFKYFNFFVDEFTKVTSATHLATHLLFPLGLSFYTFSNLSYIMDVYQGKLEADPNWVNLNLFTGYFPKIISGPIEKPKPFLAAISRKRIFDASNAIECLKLIVFGYFKKVVVADSVSPFVDNVFGAPSQYSSGVLALTAILYAFQIYADFSGYSDIARGVSGLFGIDLMVNFRFPFFSKDIGEFWRRWHISLSTWLNDYVFKPAAIEFRNLGRHGIFLAIVVTFFVSGIWHGEGITFIVWGMLHALYYIPVIYGSEYFAGITAGGTNDRILSGNIPKVLLTFILVVFALIFFRAENMVVAKDFLTGMVHFGAGHHKSLIATNTEMVQMVKSIGSVLILIFLDGMFASKGRIGNSVYYLLLALIVLMGSYSNTLSFIYFKF